ncbi:GntR family transcriptional regulator [Desulfomonile tiedjei]|uniref:Transcriptional regulator n=1 Tax=Desulfomonile tiedjei (strain ATCC 49306 / DSM 6799 / DCB-1) TaxID=706587 RepID=I4CD95_DESTA|nr:GntR family transcriptional regulator [Desulfomonile tiedjei]AFM27536.1 transcriptional regulator [Desulfomonile tiedjei DSM 6799]
MLVEIKSVSETVVDYLRTQIITGKLSANQKINENDLATSLGISRPPIREAFRILENEHLLVSIPRKGTYVSDVSIEDLTGLFQTREMIETYAFDLLKSLEHPDFSKVEATFEDAVGLSLPSIENPEEMLHFHQVFAGFHTRLVELTGNSRIIHFYKTISLNLTRYQVMYLFMPGSVDQSLEDHREILTLIQEGQYDQAKKSLLKHLEFASKVLKDRIEQNLTQTKNDVLNSTQQTGMFTGEIK